MTRSRRPLIQGSTGLVASSRRQARQVERLHRVPKKGPTTVNRVTVTGGGAIVGEISFQAVMTLDDTATGTDKARWIVSLPAGAGAVTIFKHRAVNGADANTNTTANMVFDVNLNGSPKGTVTITSGNPSGDADVTDYTISDGDRITIDKDSGNDEGTIHQVILIGKQVLQRSITS